MQAFQADLIVIPTVYRSVEQRLAAQDDFSRIHRLDKIQAAQERSLAAAGRPDNSDHFTLLQGETYIVKHFLRSEALKDVLHLKNYHQALL